MQRKNVHIKIPAQMMFLWPALAFVDELASGLGFQGEAVKQIRLALEESLTNIIKHGYADDPDGVIELVLHPRPSSLLTVIREKGMPFDPAQFPKFNAGSFSLQEDPKGVGVFLARQLMDSVEYRNLGRGGREIHLMKNIQEKHVNAFLTKEEAQQGTAPETPPLKNVLPEFVIRDFLPGEALDVSKCAYRAYGYTYEDFVYFPEQIVEMNEHGEMVSLVATTKDGDLMGHLALKRYTPDDPLAELGVLFVMPEYRGSGIGLQLNIEAVRKAESMGLRGVYVRAVTGHVASQKMTEDLRLNLTGVLVGVFPDNVDMRKLGGVYKQKMSALLFWRACAKPRVRTLYPPEHHRDMIEQLYKANDLPYVLGENPGYPAEADDEEPECVHMVQKNEILNVAEMDVLTSVPDMEYEALVSLHRLCLERTDAVYAYLDLEAPGTPELAEALENMGFFFAGVLPDRLRGKDALVLQYLNNLKIDYNAIKVHDSVAKELLGYIHDHDPFNS